MVLTAQLLCRSQAKVAPISCYRTVSVVRALLYSVGDGIREKVIAVALLYSVGNWVFKLDVGSMLSVAVECGARVGYIGFNTRCSLRSYRP